MGKKKQFIDKKSASVYHVVRRSQRDVGAEATTEELHDFVLMPSPENEERQRRLVRAQDQKEKEKENEAGAAEVAAAAPTGPTSLSKLRQNLAKAGLLDDAAATYSKFTKSITGTGTFLASDPIAGRGGGVVDSSVALSDARVRTYDGVLERDPNLREALEVREVGRMLDSIALTPDLMDNDVAAALFDDDFDFDDGCVEEILDDFCVTAAMEPVEDEADDNYDGGIDGFDYNKHIQTLMERARLAENVGADGGQRLQDDFFSNAKPLRAHKDDDSVDSLDREFDDENDQAGDEANVRDFWGQDGDKPGPHTSGEQETEQFQNYLHPSEDPTTSLVPPGVALTLDAASERALALKFEQTLLQYDSDSMGDLDDQCDDIGGDRPLEGDRGIEAVFDEFLTEQSDHVLMAGRPACDLTLDERRAKRGDGGSKYTALLGKKMLPLDELGDDVKKDITLEVIQKTKDEIRKDLADADMVLANPEMDLPPEEIFIDGKSYFTESSRNPWDCESILSTYSNLDNRPAVVGRSSRRSRKKDKRKMNKGGEAVIPEDGEGPVRIELSEKTGLPLGTFSDRQNDDDNYFDEEDDTYLSVNLGEARPSDETKEEKKDRKLAVKEERRIRRIQKKVMRETFGDEFCRRNEENAAGAADAGGGGNGAAVFRYS